MRKEYTVIETDYIWQLKNGFDESESPETCYYFQCNRRIIFIKKCRFQYLVMATSNCGFPLIGVQRTFGVIFKSTFLVEAIEKYKQLVRELLLRLDERKFNYDLTKEDLVCLV